MCSNLSYVSLYWNTHVVFPSADKPGSFCPLLWVSLCPVTLGEPHHSGL